MGRLSSGMVVPLLLAVVGVVLIIVGQLDLDQPPVSSLPPIPGPSSPVAVASSTPTARPTAGESATQPATPSPTPIPEGWVATQIQIASVGINALVKQGTPATDTFPGDDAAYILSSSSQPGRGVGTYITAHAELHLFKPLWNVQLGAEVLVRMSDDQVLQYVITEVHPNVACPDPDADPRWNPEALGYVLPLDLRGVTTCDEGGIWITPAGHERLTLQTSQGYNRNWGELIVIAEPLF